MINKVKWLSAKSLIYKYTKDNFLIFGLWILFRIITSITAAVASSIRPINEIEQRIHLWPPAVPVSDWIERVFISPWYRWDVEWYTKIILNGYSPNDGTANFHPLYPWLGKIFTFLGFRPVGSLLIISSIATLLLLLMLKRHILLDFDKNKSKVALLIILVFPIYFILFAPYPESVFLLLSVICFYFLRTKRWVFAGISAFFAVLTRQQGVFLVFPYMWEIWESSGRSINQIKSLWRSWLTILFIPFSYLLWIGYRLYIIGESIQITNNLQEIIYSVFISSSAERVVPYQGFTWPWNTLTLGYDKITTSPDLDIWINVFLILMFIGAITVGWKNMSSSNRLYSAVIFLVSFSYFTGPIHPFMGLPRHLSLAFPIFIGLTPWLSNRNLFMWLYIFISQGFMLILITAYILTAWVP